jgi:hypothetical protein
VNQTDIIKGIKYYIYQINKFNNLILEQESVASLLCSKERGCEFSRERVLEEIVVGREASRLPRPGSGFQPSPFGRGWFLFVPPLSDPLEVKSLPAIRVVVCLSLL